MKYERLYSYVTWSCVQGKIFTPEIVWRDKKNIMINNIDKNLDNLLLSYELYPQPVERLLFSVVMHRQLRISRRFSQLLVTDCSRISTPNSTFSTCTKILKLELIKRWHTKQRNINYRRVQSYLNCSCTFVHVLKENVMVYFGNDAKRHRSTFALMSDEVNHHLLVQVLHMPSIRLCFSQYRLQCPSVRPQVQYDCKRL